MEYSYTGNTGSGFYRIQPEDSLVPLDVYCDMITKDGGWTLVLLNSAYTTPPSPGWLDAIRANNVTGTLLNGIEAGFDQLLGLKYWEGLGDTLRVETGNGPVTILHRVYYTFQFDEEDHYCIYLSNEILGAGSTSPGFFTYHNYQPFTTWDSDNDGSAANCSVSYANTPWWYNSCWDGSFWGRDSNPKPYWTGSSGDYYNWGAFWIK
ncbi:MAG: hypothetical protein JXJ04_14655 [Spirochaetales bacterium]|nr:hypothetical protein [Spirochaetales bacterium]